jgi:hypothetical protein
MCPESARSRLAGLLLPKPSDFAARLRCGISDLRATVHQRPLASVARDGRCYSLGYSAGHRSEAFGYLTMIAAPVGPRAVSTTTVPVRAGVALGLVVESDRSTTAPLASCSAAQPASHRPRKHVASLRDGVLLNAEVGHRVSLRTRSVVLSARCLPGDHLIRRDLRARLLPAPIPIDLLECGSTVRSGRQR